MSHSSIGAVWRALPPLAGWSVPVVFAVFSFAVSLVFSMLGKRLARSSDEPLDSSRELWAENARRVFPQRKFVASARTLMPVLCGSSAIAILGPMATVSRPIMALLAAVFAWLAVAVVARADERRVTGIDSPWPQWLRDTVASGLVTRFPWLGVLLLAPWIVDGTRQQFWVLFAVANLLCLLGTFGGGLFIAEAIHVVRPAAGRLSRIATQASETARVPFRGVYEMPSDLANAFALPLVKRIVFTERAISVLTDEELHAICAHELGHLNESRGVAWTRVGVFVFTIDVLLGLRWFYDYGGWLGFYAAIFFYVLCAMVFRRLFARLEARADAHAREHESSEGAYARALEAIYRTNVMPAVIEGGTHPSLYDRMVACGVTPDYPRPAPPRARKATLATICAALGVTFAAASFAWVSIAKEPEDEAALRWSIWAMGGSASTLNNYALALIRHGNVDGAEAIYDVCSAFYKTSVHCPANLAITWVNEGQCRRASRMLRIASNRARRPETTESEKRLVESATRAVRSCGPSTYR